MATFAGPEAPGLTFGQARNAGEKKREREWNGIDRLELWLWFMLRLDLLEHGRLSYIVYRIALKTGPVFGRAVGVPNLHILMAINCYCSEHGMVQHANARRCLIIY